MGAVVTGNHAGGPYLNLIVANDPAPRHGGTPDQARRTGSVEGAPAWVSKSLLQSLAAELYAPITTTTPINVGSQTFPAGTYSVPQPTADEIRRETFWAEFTGRYWVGPPRFANQSSTIHIYSDGRSVTSNQFLNGRGQVLIFPPSDPTATPTTEDPVAGKVTGLMSLFAANILQSGTVLFAQVSNAPGVASNDPAALDHGLPSHLEFRIDPGGVSGGLYGTPQFTTTPATITSAATGQAISLTGGSGGAVAYNQGAGIVDIQYKPDNRLRAVARQSGTVTVRIQGLNNLTGVLNPLYKGIN
jgi:hypothetical protein